MKKEFIFTEEEQELLSITKINDLLDVFLFFVGLFIPFTGDLIESIIGTLFDLLLLYWLFDDDDIRFNAIWIFLLELLDLSDFFTLGLIDVLGWIELFPFWFLFYKSLKIKAKSENGGISPTKPSISMKKVRKKKKQFCNICGAQIKENVRICENCGAPTDIISNEET